MDVIVRSVSGPGPCASIYFISLYKDVIDILKWSINCFSHEMDTCIPNHHRYDRFSSAMSAWCRNPGYIHSLQLISMFPLSSNGMHSCLTLEARHCLRNWYLMILSTPDSNTHIPYPTVRNHDTPTHAKYHYDYSEGSP